MAVPQIGCFRETTAGEIIAPNCQTVVKVMVENMTTTEASRMVRAITAALAAEFANEAV